MGKLNYFDCFVLIALLLISQCTKTFSSNASEVYPEILSSTYSSVLHGAYPNDPLRQRPNLAIPKPVTGGMNLETFIQKHRGKAENYYEPYWSNGQWVFYREYTVRTPKRKVTDDPNYTTTTEKLGKNCNPLCLNMFKAYGPVCGMRLNQYIYTWLYEYKSFDDYCKLEIENCKIKSKRHHYVPVQKRKCYQAEYGFTNMENAQEVKKRKIQFLEQFKQSLTTKSSILNIG